MHSLETSSGKAVAVHVVEYARAIECKSFDGGWISRHYLKSCPRAGCEFNSALHLQHQLPHADDSNDSSDKDLNRTSRVQSSSGSTKAITCWPRIWGKS